MNLQEDFGCMVFNDNVMRQRLPKETYRALHRTIAEGKRLDTEVAGVVANTMKDWAIENGATHFTHWFQPMTGITAEKHEAFLTPIEGGGAIMEFGGKELVRGESDASSFPSGGLRATFEARGYTAWDPTSYAFIKDRTLCIPTAFCSYSGQALDKKTPLLRSMDAVNREAKRLLRLLGQVQVKQVVPMVGAEQEYFLIDRDLFEKRMDLKYTGRTLFGAKPPKMQELSDHYSGSLKPRVSAFMQDVDEQLWQLGVPAKTEHNEAAPCQHELAALYSTANISTDHNQLIMETLKRTAARHGFACLLAEKPFRGVNGSGKHDNWSLCTNQGTNLLEPGDTPADNAQFLLFLAAVIRAVDEHQDLLRASVASAGNDFRLGGHEAPPAIISVFLGDELQAVIEALIEHRSYEGTGKSDMNIGVTTMPRIPKDNTDRNRTSPIAFTGNKFEFRMPGASMSVADANIIINTIVADVLRDFADRLEKCDDIRTSVEEIVINTVTEHQRILFAGNNYSDEWKQEALKRGLKNLETLPDAVPCLIEQDNIALFERHGVYTAAELSARYDILLENYCSVTAIEAHTMIDMVNRQILPAITRFAGDTAQQILSQKALLPSLALPETEKKVSTLGKIAETLAEQNGMLIRIMEDIPKDADNLTQAKYFRTHVLRLMDTVRSLADEAETMIDRTYWPMPCYSELLTQAE